MIIAMIEDIFTGQIFIKIIGSIAGILTSVSMLPQIIKTIKKKEAKDISVIMIIVLMTGLGCWIYYGVLRKDMPIIFTNSFSFLLNTILLVLRWKYKSK